MRYFTTKNTRISGMSLIEIMIVVAIIGILSTIAITKFSAFKSRSYRAEAMSSLYKIHTLQATYHSENEIYSELTDVGYSVTSGPAGETTECNAENDLGFKLTDCRKARYRYNIPGPMDHMDYLATATAEPLSGDINLVYPRCAIFDLINMNAGRSTSIVIDSIRKCDI